MKQTNLTNKQLSELDYLFELVSQRQIKDFGKISASNKADGSLITSCDLWSDKTIVEGLASIAPEEGVLVKKVGNPFLIQKHIGWSIHLTEQQICCRYSILVYIGSEVVEGRPQSSFLIIPTLKKSL